MLLEFKDSREFVFRPQFEIVQYYGLGKLIAFCHTVLEQLQDQSWPHDYLESKDLDMNLIFNFLPLTSKPTH